jgi:hypothetical protein
VVRMRAFEGFREAWTGRRPRGDAGNQRAETKHPAILSREDKDDWAVQKWPHRASEFPHGERWDFLYEAPEMLDFVTRAEQGRVLWVT